MRIKYTNKNNFHSPSALADGNMNNQIALTVLTVLNISLNLIIYILAGGQMSKHSYNKIWMHFIWETLDKQKILTKDVRVKLSKFLFAYCKEKNIYMNINYVNADHVHTLIDLPTNLSVEECIKLLKGSSSHYINKNRLTNTKFSWGRGYGAFSVSASQVENVTAYIINQEEHHRVKSFAEEYKMFIEKYGVNG